MIEKACNLWMETATYRCVPTSAAVNDDGEAVMDSGIAKEATSRFSGLALDLGRLLASRGNHVHLVRPGIVSFPIKQYQWSKPDLMIIQRSARELCELVGDEKTLLPRPGCGQGELSWEQVSQALGTLPDNIVVVEHT